MSKTHSKPLAARHGRGTAWARHALCESALIDILQEDAIRHHIWVGGIPTVYLRGPKLKSLFRDVCHDQGFSVVLSVI
jgi:hypothetical protein